MYAEDIVERFTQVKGVRRWTVELLLSFGLGREDVLPIHDLGSLLDKLAGRIVELDDGVQ